MKTKGKENQQRLKTMEQTREYKPKEKILKTQDNEIHRVCEKK